MSTLLPCPFDGAKASTRRESDSDGCRWTYVACDKCGARTRGKWVSHYSDECPLFFEEVREEWNQRAAMLTPAEGAEKP